MIINWEKGRKLFGNSEELYKSELFNFVHTVVPKSSEKATNFLFEKNCEGLKQELIELQGSSKLLKKSYLCRATISGAQAVHRTSRVQKRN